MRVLAFLTVFISIHVLSQDTTSVNTKRLWLVAGGGGAAWAGTIIGLNEVWYEDQERTDFHFFDDSYEWLQMDKMGHAMVGYELGRAGDDALSWAGVNRKTSLWCGGLFGAAYLTTFEILDGYARDWGFSWSDVGANFTGSALYIGQELLWEEQRIKPKFSAHLTDYAALRPAVLGSSWGERMLKDYNGQTYWLSFNVASFLSENTRFPGWLNVAIGYSGNEMVVGDKDSYAQCDGTNCTEYTRYRQYLLSLDIDLTKLNIESNFLRSITKAFGWIKVPFPALEFSTRGVKGYWFYF